MSAEVVRLTVDSRQIEVPGDYTLLQACELAGAEIPRFCYHERLSIAGNCRMCLVEVAGNPKPVASCAQSVADLGPGRDGLPPVVLTGSEMVHKARQGVMEFLLINHPLDCPICDQGGECDLQDQAVAYGRGVSRYSEAKRAVPESSMGPLIKTSMTRCIQCTRCVRFAAEVAGVEEIGLLGRGEDARILSWLEQSLSSELSGNVIDLCPVGALTSRPFAFHARSWEMRPTYSVDVMDAVGSAIRVDTRGGVVMRILPVVDDSTNEEWLSDKARFIWDGLARQRLDAPLLRRDGRLVRVDWDRAVEVATERLSGPAGRIAALAGDMCCAEGIKATGDLMRSLGVVSMDCRQDGARIGQDETCQRLPRRSWLFNSTIAGVDKADALLLVGCNPRREAPVLNARFRRRWSAGVPVGVIGERIDLTYGYEHLAESLSGLDQDCCFMEVLRAAQRPMIVVGQGALARSDGGAILHWAAGVSASCRRTSDWDPFNVLHTAAGRVAGLDLDFLPGKGGLDSSGILAAARSGGVDTLVLLGVDECDLSGLSGCFTIYIGSHGDAGASVADLILPAPAYTEASAVFVNTEGRVRHAQQALPAVGEARSEWAIMRAISERLGHVLPYDNRSELVDVIVGAIEEIAGQAAAPVFGQSGEFAPAPLRSPIVRYHLTNPIARASKTMAECAVLAERQQHSDAA